MNIKYLIKFPSQSLKFKEEVDSVHSPLVNRNDSDLNKYVYTD